MESVAKPRLREQVRTVMRITTGSVQSRTHHYWKAENACFTLGNGKTTFIKPPSACLSPYDASSPMPGVRLPE